jgi:flagellar hook-basal body complex protein FliE
MSIEAIGALPSAAGETLAAARSKIPAASSFSTMLDRLSGLNEQLTSAEHDVQQLALGKTDNLHQVMIDMEQAKLQLDLLLQVRSKVLDAYQELMRMQV